MNCGMLSHTTDTKVLSLHKQIGNFFTVTMGVIHCNTAPSMGVFKITQLASNNVQTTDTLKLKLLVLVDFLIFLREVSPRLHLFNQK